MTLRIGISGWRYAPWRGDFYPTGLPQRRELEYASRRLTSIEINASFYALQRPSSYARWRAAVPEGFVFAVKGSRYITHLMRLRDPERPLANFLASGVLALGPSLGPFLWQLPESLPFDPGLLRAFLAALPRTTTQAAALAARHDARLGPDRVLTTADADRPLRHALEFRSPSFVDERAFALLADHGVASVVADTAGRWPEVERLTAPFVYCRLHGHRELYAGGYPPAALDAWAERCRAWADAGRDVYVYFDNDARGRAPHDAEGLLARLADVPITPGRAAGESVT